MKAREAQQAMKLVGFQPMAQAAAAAAAPAT